MPGALQFLAVVAAMQHLSGAEGSGHVDVGLVAEDVLGLVQCPPRRRHHQLGAAGPQADHCESAATLADAVHRQGRGGHRQPVADLLGGGQGLAQARSGIGLRQEAQRYAERIGGGLQARIGHPRAVGQQAAERRRGQAGIDQRLAHRVRRRVGRFERRQHAARMDQQFLGPRRTRRGRHVNRQRCLRVARQTGRVEPVGGTLDAHRLATEQIGNEALALLQVGQDITGGRVEHAGAEAQLAAGGDRRRHGQHLADFPRQPVDPASPPSSGTTALPSSARASTGGSAPLRCNNGARLRMTMPAAHRATIGRSAQYSSRRVSPKSV